MADFIGLDDIELEEHGPDEMRQGEGMMDEAQLDERSAAGEAANGAAEHATVLPASAPATERVALEPTYLLQAVGKAYIHHSEPPDEQMGVAQAQPACDEQQPMQQGAVCEAAAAAGLQAAGELGAAGAEGAAAAVAAAQQQDGQLAARPAAEQPDWEHRPDAGGQAPGMQATALAGCTSAQTGISEPVAAAAAAVPPPPHEPHPPEQEQDDAEAGVAAPDLEPGELQADQAGSPDVPTEGTQAGASMHEQANQSEGVQQPEPGTNLEEATAAAQADAVGKQASAAAADDCNTRQPEPVDFAAANDSVASLPLPVFEDRGAVAAPRQQQQQQPQDGTRGGTSPAPTEAPDPQQRERGGARGSSAAANGQKSSRNDRPGNHQTGSKDDVTRGRKRSHSREWSHEQGGGDPKRRRRSHSLEPAERHVSTAGARPQDGRGLHGEHRHDPQARPGSRWQLREWEGRPGRHRQQQEQRGREPPAMQQGLHAAPEDPQRRQRMATHERRYEQAVAAVNARHQARRQVQQQEQRRQGEPGNMRRQAWQEQGQQPSRLARRDPRLRPASLSPERSFGRASRPPAGFDEPPGRGLPPHDPFMGGAPQYGAPPAGGQFFSATVYQPSPLQGRDTPDLASGLDAAPAGFNSVQRAFPPAPLTPAAAALPGFGPPPGSSHGSAPGLLQQVNQLPSAAGYVAAPQQHVAPGLQPLQQPPQHRGGPPGFSGGMGLAQAGSNSFQAGPPGMPAAAGSDLPPSMQPFPPRAVAAPGAPDSTYSSARPEPPFWGSEEGAAPFERGWQPPAAQHPGQARMQGRAGEYAASTGLPVDRRRYDDRAAPPRQWTGSGADAGPPSDRRPPRQRHRFEDAPLDGRHNRAPPPLRPRDPRSNGPPPPAAAVAEYEVHGPPARGWDLPAGLDRRPGPHPPSVDVSLSPAGHMLRGPAPAAPPPMHRDSRALQPQAPMLGGGPGPFASPAQPAPFGAVPAAGMHPEEEQVWYYSDPKGVLQGPHSISQFRRWLDSLSRRPDLREDYLAFRNVAVFRQDGGAQVPLIVLVG